MSSDDDRLLAKWETDSSLFEPQSVRRRFDVLDQLDFHFGQDNWQPSNDALSIPGRAASLRARLEAANSAICSSIRSYIQHGICPSALVSDLRTYDRQPPTPGLGYDHLDEFLSGILQLRAPEDTNITPEPEMVFYQPTPVRHIVHLITLAAFTASDVLVDIGSGLGHVPLLVSILTGIRAVGIELNPSYVSSARECARNLGLERVAFLRQDARTADLTAGTLFYLYTPFTGALLQAVLARLRQEAATRTIRVATLGPCTNVVANEIWLSPCSTPNPDRISLFISQC